MAENRQPTSVRKDTTVADDKNVANRSNVGRKNVKNVDTNVIDVAGWNDAMFCADAASATPSKPDVTVVVPVRRHPGWQPQSGSDAATQSPIFGVAETERRPKEPLAARPER